MKWQKRDKEREKEKEKLPFPLAYIPKNALYRALHIFFDCFRLSRRAINFVLIWENPNLLELCESFFLNRE